MIIRTTGLNPKDTQEFRVFFRQNLSGINFKDVFDELSWLGNSGDKMILHLEIKVSPMLGLQEVQWYQIIRYCLFCVGQRSIASAVFSAPTSSEMNLYVLTSGASLDVIREVRWLINQMMAVKIALWAAKPAYLNLTFDRHQIETHAQYILYVDKALYNALDVYKVSTIYELKERIYTLYALEIRIPFKLKNAPFVRLANGKFPWIMDGEISLSKTDIKMWMRFNQMIKNDPMAERIGRGVIAPAP